MNFITKEQRIVSGFPKKIGGIEVDNPVWLAPLAGISYYSLRKFQKNLGAGLVHTEMISAMGLCYKGRKTKELLHGDDEEAPVILQLFGSCAEDMCRGAEVALSIRKFDGLQVNMACPMPKVTKKGSGAELMNHKGEAALIISELKKFGLPVWSKTRVYPSGADETLDFCARLFSAGADLIFIHGRTCAQRYEGTARRDITESAAKEFPCMIGASGDCFSPEDFIDYLDRGCAAVLAARGINRDYCVIPKTLKKLGAAIPDEYVKADPDFNVKLLLELGRSIYNTEGESAAIGAAHRTMNAVFKGLRGAAALRRKASFIRCWQDMEELLANWRETVDADAPSESFKNTEDVI